MPITAEPGPSRVALQDGALLHDRYRLTGRLGSGGMADVYLAQDERLGRQVAVKVLRRRFDEADEQLVRRFQVEAKAAAMLSHPAIVAVFDQGQAGDHWYLVMEYVRGETLKQRLKREGALPVASAVAVVRAVLAALGTAHARDVIHRDVTSQNILLDEAGAVKVADFGIARIGAPDLTRTGTMIGTCHYLSPEQAQGKAADRRSDLYGAGVVLFEALTGRLPFEGDSEVAVALKHVQEPAPLPSSMAAGVTSALDAVVIRALAKDPDTRFQTAAAFEEALVAAARGQTAPELQAGVTVAGAGPTAAVPAPANGTRILPPEADTRVEPAMQAPDGRTSRRAGRRTLVVVLAVLVALAAVGAALYAYAAGGVGVPQVVGLAEAQAKGAVRDAGLRPVTHRAYVDGVAAGVVARQRPGQGELDEGARVDIWVSRGPLHIPAPDLKGQTPDETRQALSDADLAGDARKTRSQTIEEGLVARQDPSAGSTVTRGDTIIYWVSGGPPLIEVPDVVGLSSGDAAFALEDAGLTVNVDLVAGFGEYPGDVVGQDPAAGATLEWGDEVTIEVAVF